LTSDTEEWLSSSSEGKSTVMLEIRQSVVPRNSLKTLLERNPYFW
jgi:hypothetical protein